MTNDQFNNCKLPKRLDFKLVEAARLVLVHQLPIQTALTLSGLHQVNDAEKLAEAIKMFESCF